MRSHRGAAVALLSSVILSATGCCLEIVEVADTSPTSIGSSSGGYRPGASGGTTTGTSSGASTSSTSAAGTSAGSTGSSSGGTSGRASSSAGSTTGSAGEGCTIDGQFYPALSVNSANVAQCCNPAINSSAWVPLFVKAMSFPVNHEDSNMTGFAGANDGLVADLNGDGIADVVATVYMVTASILGQSQAWVWLSSDGGFVGPTTYPATYPSEIWPGGLTYGDFNNDGIPDLAVSTSTSLEIRLGTGAGQFGGEQYISSSIIASCNAGYGYVRVLDANSDGWLDVVESSQCGLLVYLNDALGDGKLLNPVEMDSSVSENPLSPGDFNGDGLIDLAFIDQSSSLAWFQNSASGLDYSEMELSLSSVSNMVSFAGSAGDGLAVTSGNSVQIFLPSSSGPDGPTSYPTDVGGYIAAGDLNGDGLPDLIVVGGATIDILINQGNGQFSQAASVQISTPGSQFGIQRIGAGDLNGDGVADLVLFWGYGPWEGWIDTCGPGAAATLAADGANP